MNAKQFLALLIALSPVLSFADEYSTEGIGFCFLDTASCGVGDHKPEEKPTTFEECKAKGGLISWLNTQGKCIYRDPSGD